MTNKHRTLIFIWAIDAAVTIVAIGHCDYVTPKLTALGISLTLLLAFIICSGVIRGFAPRIKPGISGFFLLLWVAALSISAAAGPRPRYSFSEIGLPALYLLTYFAVRWSAGDKDSPSFLGLAVPVIFGFLFSLHGILQYFGGDILPNMSRYAFSGARSLHVYSLFGNSNLLADFLAPVFTLALAIAFCVPTNKNNKRLAGFAAAAILSAIILTGSRAAVLAAVFGAIFLSAGAAASGGKKTKTAVYIAAVAAAVILIAVSTVYIPGKKSSVPMRFVYWRAAVSMFAKRPLLGGGPGYFKLDYINFQREYFKGPHPKDSERVALIEKPGHPHNEYLNSLADTGIVGLLFLALAIGSGIILGLRQASRGSPAGAAWASALATFAVVAFFSFPLRIPATGVLLPIFLAFLDENPAAPPGASNRVPLPAALDNSIAKAAICLVVLCAASFAAYTATKPLEAQILLTNAKRFIEENRPDLALDQTEKALKIYPTDAETLFTEGVVYLATGRAKEALPYFIKAKKTSGDPSLYYNMGLAYSEAGDLKSAASYMEFYSQAIPADIRAEIFLTDFYYKMGFIDAALVELAKAKRLANELLKVHLLNDETTIGKLSQFEAQIRAGGKPAK